MNTRKVSKDPDKPLTVRINLDHRNKLKVKIKCLRHGVTLTEMVERSLLDWVKDIPDDDVVP